MRKKHYMSVEMTFSNVFRCKERLKSLKLCYLTFWVIKTLENVILMTYNIIFGSITSVRYHHCHCPPSLTSVHDIKMTSRASLYCPNRGHLIITPYLLGSFEAGKIRLCLFGMTIITCSIFGNGSNAFLSMVLFWQWRR